MPYWQLYNNVGVVPEFSESECRAPSASLAAFGVLALNTSAADFPLAAADVFYEARNDAVRYSV